MTLKFKVTFSENPSRHVDYQLLKPPSGGEVKSSWDLNSGCQKNEYTQKQNRNTNITIDPRICSSVELEVEKGTKIHVSEQKYCKKNNTGEVRSRLRHNDKEQAK